MGSISCTAATVQPGRLRAVVESILVHHLEDKLYKDLVTADLAEHYIEVAVLLFVIVIVVIV